MLQLPAIYTKPLSDNFVTDGDLLLELAAIAWKSPENPDGLVLDEWQAWLIRAMLERYPDDWHVEALRGRLRYRQLVASVGRQNGKSLIAALLGLYGLLMHSQGASVLSLASSMDQARIIYSRVLFVINSNPYLKKRFKKATEQRGIVTADGSGRYDVKPAKESALQGIPISLCLFDELHLAKEGMWTAAVTGTSSYKDGIVIGITTAGDQNSTTLLNLYEAGKAAVDGANERFGFFLWTAPDNSSVDDPEAIKAANPSVAAGRVSLENTISDIKTLPEHEARRYRLNQFISGSTASWLPMQLFRNCEIGQVQVQTGAVFAVDITRNWEYATIAVANRNGDKQETELVQTFVAPTEQRLFDELIRLYKIYSPRAIVLDDRQLPNLAKRLKQSGVRIWQLWTKEISAACSAVYAMFAAGQIQHNNDPLLIAQMSNGVTKYTGETWLISRKESVGEIDALMSTVMALYVSDRAQHAGVGVF
jgi:phage terminase large subunit-like protein